MLKLYNTHMTVKEIYEKYKIPPNLQKHMLRVAGVAQIITKNWSGVIDETSVVSACLFHDMANIIKFRMDKPSLFKDEEIQKEYWKGVQKEYINKYGNDVHKATLIICEKIGLPQKVLRLIENLDWNNTQKVIDENDFECGIPLYADMRMGPFGILPLGERFENLKTRANHHNFDGLYKAALLLEKKLQKMTMIDLQSITDIQLTKKFNSLSGLEILTSF